MIDWTQGFQLFVGSNEGPSDMINGTVVNREAMFLPILQYVSLTEGVCEIPLLCRIMLLLKMPDFEEYGCHDGLPLKIASGKRINLFFTAESKFIIWSVTYKHCLVKHTVSLEFLHPYFLVFLLTNSQKLQRMLLLYPHPFNGPILA